MCLKKYVVSLDSHWTNLRFLDGHWTGLGLVNCYRVRNVVEVFMLGVHIPPCGKTMIEFCIIRSGYAQFFYHTQNEYYYIKQYFCLKGMSTSTTQIQFPSVQPLDRSGQAWTGLDSDFVCQICVFRIHISHFCKMMCDLCIILFG